MEGFRFVTPIAVRFRDLDAFGHVNNAVYATYFELGRIAFYRTVFERPFEARGFDFIVARLEVDFRHPVQLEDDCLLGVRVGRIGNSSFVFEYRLEANGSLAALGSTVQVFFDYQRNAKLPVPDRFRERVAGYLAPG